MPQSSPSSAGGDGDGGGSIVDSRDQTLRRTLNQLFDSASSVLSLALQWQDVEEQFNCANLEALAKKERELEERICKIEARKRREREWLETSLEELEVVRDFVEGKLKEAADIEERVELLERAMKEVNESMKEIEVKERRVEVGEKRLQEGLKKLVLKEKGIGFKEKRLEEGFKEIKLKEERLERQCREVELKEKKLEEGFREIKLKGEQLDARCQEVELRDKKLEEGFMEIKLKEEQLARQCGEVELKEKKLDEEFREIKLKEQKLEARCQEVELKDKKLEEGFEEIKMKEKQLEKQCWEASLRDKKLEEQFTNLELKEKQLEALFAERFKKLELKEKQLEDKCKEVENTQVKKEPLDDANLCFSVVMDGKALQIFLNERWKEHDLLRNDILGALKYSSDPAKLVLDAMQGFYPPHLKKGEVEFEKCVVQRSCILLLDQLMKISPSIKSHVREEAVKLSFDWMTKARKDADHPLEILGFLQLVASYGLASVFDTDELLNYLEIVAQHSQAAELLRALGFVDKISGFVHKLLQKNWLLEAIRYIYEFKIVNQFPPAPILKRYLQIAKDTARGIKRRGGKSLKAEIEATDKRVSDIKAALTCIEDYNIRCQVSSQQLKQMIRSMETENLIRKSKFATRGRKTQLKKKWSAPNLIAAAAPACVLTTHSRVVPPIKTSIPIAPTFAPASKTASQQQSGVKRPLTAMSAEDDPKAFICTSATTPKIFPSQQPEQIAQLEKQKEDKMLISEKVKSEAGPCTRSEYKLVDNHKKESDDSTTAPEPPAAPPSTMVASLLSTSAPTPPTVNENQPQQQNGNKRPRTVVSTQEPPKASFGSTYIGDPWQPPRQQPPGPFMSQGGPYMNTPPCQYSLVGYPPRNMQPSYPNVIPCYQWDPRGNPGHVWRMPFGRN